MREEGECHCGCHVEFKGIPLMVHCMPCCHHCYTCGKNIHFAFWVKHLESHLEKGPIPA